MTSSNDLQTAELFDALKKGDKIDITYDSTIRANATASLMVKNRTVVGVGKKWESEKITFVNLNNPTGVKFFGYKRKDSGYIGYAIGDLAIWNVKLVNNNKMAMGGMTASFSYSVGGL